MHTTSRLNMYSNPWIGPIRCEQLIRSSCIRALVQRMGLREFRWGQKCTRLGEMGPGIMRIDRMEKEMFTTGKMGTHVMRVGEIQVTL